MKEKDILNKIKTIVKNNLDLDIPDEKVNFMNDLGIDSLDLVEMIMAIETEFNISISDEELSKIRTVKDLKEMIKSKLK